MDVIIEDIEEETPWAMLFAYDIALSVENCDQAEGRLELWRTSVEDVHLKLSRKKTENLPPPVEQKNINLKEYNSSKDSITLVNTTVGETGEIEIKIGLHQGSALSLLLFIIIVDVITEDIEECCYHGQCCLFMTLHCREKIVTK